jgi:hypothetical protein
MVACRARARRAIAIPQSQEPVFLVLFFVFLVRWFFGWVVCHVAD